MKIILGNGLSARIFALYNPEYVRVAPRAQSQLDVASFLHSLILPHSETVLEFLEDLGIEDPGYIDVEIGWYRDFDYHSGEPPSSVREQLMHKKLSGATPSSSLFEKELILAEPYLDGENRGMMRMVSISMSKVLEAIQKKIYTSNIIEGTVGEIAGEEVILLDGRRFKYRHLVSTIPANRFWSIYKGPDAEHKVFVGSSLYTGTMSKDEWSASGYPELPDPVMCYFPEKKFAFDRVRQLSVHQGDVLAIEGPQEFRGSVHMPFARILRAYDNIAPKNIAFLGRYAEWNPSVTAVDVMRRSADKFFMDTIFSDQKSFNRKFINYAPDIDNVQRGVKDYVLHLFSESNSLLDCINWKVGLNDEIKLNREKILEEWIDVFKFFLSIGHLFGFEVRDLVDMYWKKSAKVVEKYKAKEQ